MKILFADALPEAYVDLLAQQGDECTVSPELGADDIPDAIEGYDVLVVRSTKVTAEAIGRSSRLGLIVRSGAGTNTIDCQAAADAGIYVCNVPGTNSIAVAELTLGLLLAVDRHIPAATGDLKNGIWNKKGYSKADGLMGKTFGVIGVGEIGLAVAERARSFGMTVVAERKADRRHDGLDVFRQEPDSGTGEFNSVLASHPNVVGTHHIGASTQQAQDATSAGTVDVIEAYRAGDPQNCVNVVRTRVGSATITIRHFDRVGVLAAALQVLRRGNINVQTMANKVFQGSNAAMAIIDVVGEVNDDLTSELASLDNVIQVQITARDE